MTTETNTYPDVAACLRASDFTAARALISTAHDAYKTQTNYETSEALNIILGNIGNGNTDLLAQTEEWLRQCPDDAYANLCVAGMLYALAEKHRGSCLADEVKDSDWQAIHHYCKRAQQAAERAISLGAPAGYLIGLLMWQEQIIGSQSQAEALFQRVLQLDATWLGCWVTMISIKDPRWGGSEPEMRAILDMAPQYFQDQRSVNDLQALFADCLGGYLQCFEERYEEALQLLEPAQQLNASNYRLSGVWEGCGWCYQGLEQYDKALNAWLTAHQYVPSSNNLRRAGWCLKGYMGRGPEAVPHYVKAIEFNDEAAMRCAYDLAIAYRDSNLGVPENEIELGADPDFDLGVERDLELSRTYFVRNAEIAKRLGDSENEAWAYHGIATSWLKRVRPDEIPNAILYFEKAIALGLLDGMTSMANIYAGPRWGCEDQAAATEWYRKAGEAGDDKSFRIYVDRVINDAGVNADRATKKELLRQSGERGNIGALRRLAWFEIEDKQLAQAEMLLWRAVQEDEQLEDSRGVQALAFGLINGWFGTPDWHRAEQLLEESIKKMNRNDHYCAISKMLLHCVSGARLKFDWSAVQIMRQTLKIYLGMNPENTLVGESAKRQLDALPGGTLGTIIWSLGKMNIPQPGMPEDLWER